MGSGVTAPRLVELSEIPALLRIGVPGPVRRGGDTTASSPAAASAGGPFPVLAAAGGQGLASAYAGPHGTGPFGESVRAALAASAVALLTRAETTADSAGTIELIEADGTASLLRVPSRLCHSASDPYLDPHLDRRSHLDGVTAQSGDLLHLTGDDLHDPDRAERLLGWLARQPLSAVLLYDPGEGGHLLPVALRARLLSRVDWWVGTTTTAHAATRMEPAAAVAALGRVARSGALVTGPSSVVVSQHRSAPLMVSTALPHPDVVARLAAGLARGEPASEVLSQR